MVDNNDGNKTIKAVLALSDGYFFYGRGYGKDGDSTVGEVVFNTAISGYQEILTDPSYDGQIINFTHPHIGNTGVNSNDNESVQPRARGMIAKHICAHYSNWRATDSLPNFLHQQKIIAIDSVDTRAITRHLRDNGAQGGCIVVYSDNADSAAALALKKAKAFADSGGLNNQMLAKTASGTLAINWQNGAWQPANDSYIVGNNAKRRVVVLDCGVKHNILRELTARQCQVFVLAYNSTLNDILAHNPNGVLFSNGPGNPAPCDSAKQLAGELLAKRIPLFGLCLGHQIISAALGANTEKMKFGHHGANHPVRDANGCVLITSQNHGFAVCADSLPQNCRVTHVSLFDGSLQGIRSDDPPLITFQGHPEASPGPRDAGVLFDDFVSLIDAAHNA